MRRTVPSRTRAASAYLAVTVVFIAVTAGVAAARAPHRIKDWNASIDGTTSVTTAAQPTATGEMLVAYVSSDGPSTSNSQTATVSGCGLTWSLLARQNTQYGDAEAWSATTSAANPSCQVTATAARTGYYISLTAADYGATGVPTATGANAATGAAQVTVTGVPAGSAVWMVGEDWDRPIARTLLAGNAMIHQYLAPSGDTLWAQNIPGASSGTVTVGTSAPTADRWNAVAVVIPPAVAPTPTPTPTPTPSPTPTPTPTPTPPPGGVTLTAPDGGADPYMGRLPLTTAPIGVWFESVSSTTDTNTDLGAGLNTYVELTANSTVSYVAAAGMKAIDSNITTGVGPETAGWLIDDELDMRAGPGWDAWSGATSWPMCTAGSSAKCGYTVTRAERAQRPQGDGRFFYANYGKGITFWESNAEASVFVNGGTPPGGTYGPFQDLVSADNYWYTDPNIHGQWEGASLVNGSTGPLTDAQTHRAANYGLTVKRVRGLASPAKPVWGFVELGGPSTQNQTVASFIQPRQVDAAVWHSLIAGARGIIYFNHTFGLASCQTQHLLRDYSNTACGYDKIRNQVIATDAKVQTATAAINGQFATFAGTTPGGLATTGNVTASARWDGTHFWVLAGHNGNQGDPATQATFALPCVGNATVTVMGENRTVAMAGGTFADGFADDLTTHVYRVDGGSRCGL